MPFHSTETEQEAFELMDKFCHLKRFRIGGAFKIEQVVTVTWSSSDIIGAMKSAASQFDLEPL